MDGDKPGMDWPVTTISFLFFLIINFYQHVQGTQQENNSILLRDSWTLAGRSKRSAVKAPICYFPFIANGISYTSCTMAGQTRSYWCATTDNFDRDGQWSWCNGPGTSSYLACYFPFQYQEKLHTSCLLDNGGNTWCGISPNYDRDGKGIYCLEVDFRKINATMQPEVLGSGLLTTTTITIEPTSKPTVPPTKTPLSTGTTPGMMSQDVPLESTLPAMDTASSSSVQTYPPDNGLQSVSLVSQNLENIVSKGGMKTTGIGSTSTATDTPPGTTAAAMNFSPTTGDSSYRDSTSNSSNWVQLTEWLQRTSLNSSMEIGLGIIPDLQKYTSSVSPSGFYKDEVALIVYILGNITENAIQSNQTFEMSTVMDILYIANQLLNKTSWRPATSANNVLGPQLLRCFENILERIKMANVSFNVSYENIEFHCLVAPCVNMSNETSLRLEPHISIALSSEDSQQTFHPTCLVNIFLLSYKSPNMDFPNRYEQEEGPPGSFKVDSKILTNVMLLDDQSYHNPNLNLSFQCNSRSCDPTAICVFWNFTTNMWSSDGCTSEVVGGVTNCFCHHLTSFSVLFAKYIPQDLKNSSVLDYITITGLVISIVSLVLCISFQVYVLRVPMNLVAYYRHMAILNVSIFLFLSNVSFIAASYVTPQEHLRLCVGLTFCTHFSLLAFFCWTLVQSLFLFCRLVFVFHHITKKEFMSLSVGLGYVCPSIIAIGTFLYYTPTNDYRKDNVCWLESDSGACMAFNVPTIIILFGNFLVLLVVIRKLLRPSISEGNSEDEEVIKKLVKAVVFCTPQFGLTWAVGIPLLTDASSDALHYLFVLLNPLQGFFIFIFGCLLDKKVMDLVKKRLSKSPVFSSMATTVSSY